MEIVQGFNQVSELLSSLRNLRLKALYFVFHVRYVGPLCPIYAVNSSQKTIYVDFQKQCDPNERRNGSSVSPSLIFLNLLIADSKHFTKGCQAYPAMNPQLTKICTEHDIVRVQVWPFVFQTTLHHIFARARFIFYLFFETKVTWNAVYLFQLFIWARLFSCTSYARALEVPKRTINA